MFTRTPIRSRLLGLGKRLNTPRKLERSPATSRSPAELRARRRAMVLEAALAAARASTAKARGDLAAARATIRTLVDAGLADDDARDQLIAVLSRQLVGLQGEVTETTHDLQIAVDEVDRQDAHISDLKMALLGEPPSVAQ